MFGMAIYDILIMVGKLFLLEETNGRISTTSNVKNTSSMHIVFYLLEPDRVWLLLCQKGTQRIKHVKKNFTIQPTTI